MKNPNNSKKQSIAGDDACEDSLEQTVSPIAMTLLELISRRGPCTIRQLMSLGPFNYSTINPVLGELVEKGFLLRDEKVSSGSALYFHLTNDGIRLLVPSWEEMTILEKLRSTHPHNFQDLGIISDLETYLSNQPETMVRSSDEIVGPNDRIDNTDSKSPTDIDPELWKFILTLARSDNRGCNSWAVGGLCLIIHPDKFLEMKSNIERSILEREVRLRSDSTLWERIHDRLHGVN